MPALPSPRKDTLMATIPSPAVRTLISTATEGLAWLEENADTAELDTLRTRRGEARAAAHQAFVHANDDEDFNRAYDLLIAIDRY
ncbi:hypothetical protein SEA_DMPSTRDIVER_239 [Mycobacterium phage DmpstrDiver]|nr:hypothetical protein SEA_DMPSTRDIVER_239 [Mycobacterium phage DmpstrDiver]